MAKSSDAAKLREWQGRLAKYKTSGLSVAAFCRLEKIGPTRFYYWSQRVQQAESRGDVQLRKEAEHTALNSSVEILIGEQVKVRLPAENADFVAAVLRQLTTPLSHGAFQRVELDGPLVTGQ